MLAGTLNLGRTYPRSVLRRLWPQECLSGHEQRQGPTCVSSGIEMWPQVVGQGMEPVPDPAEFSSGTAMWAQETSSGA